MANPNIGEIGKTLGGRPKGSKDKISRCLKERVLTVWDELREQDKDLQQEAEKDPKWFYVNFVKPMLPKDVTVKGDEDNPLITEIVIKHVNAGS